MNLKNVLRAFVDAGDTYIPDAGFSGANLMFSTNQCQCSCMQPRLMAAPNVDI